MVNVLLIPGVIRAACRRGISGDNRSVRGLGSGGCRSFEDVSVACLNPSGLLSGRSLEGFSYPGWL